MPPPKKKPTGKLKHPNVVLVRLDDDEVVALTSYIEKQEVRPERPAVLVAALRQFLSERGYLPRNPK